jgi:hypothetical protein
MNFDPTNEQRRWRDLARDFAQGEIRPRAADLDRKQKFPDDIIAEMAGLGPPPSPPTAPRTRSRSSSPGAPRARTSGPSA